MNQPTMRRAPKPETIQSETNQEPLDLCLSLWKDWMQFHDKDLGAKTMRGLTGEGDGYGGDLNDEQRQNDMKIAAATDAMIASLELPQQWAIKRAFDIAKVWRFAQLDFQVVYFEARKELEKKLQKNICTAVLF